MLRNALVCLCLLFSIAGCTKDNYPCCAFPTVGSWYTLPPDHDDTYTYLVGYASSGKKELANKKAEQLQAKGTIYRLVDDLDSVMISLEPAWVAALKRHPTLETYQSLEFDEISREYTQDDLGEIKLYLVLRIENEAFLNFVENCLAPEQRSMFRQKGLDRLLIEELHRRIAEQRKSYGPGF